MTLDSNRMHKYVNLTPAQQQFACIYHSVLYTDLMDTQEKHVHELNVPDIAVVNVEGETNDPH